MKLSKVRQYLCAPSSKLGFFAGMLMYLSYAFAHNVWLNQYLIYVCLFVALFIPHFSKLSNKAEEIVQLKTANVTFGRIARFIFQLLFNLTIFDLFVDGQVIQIENIKSIGGPWGIATLTTLASQGLQYLAIVLSNREYGNKNKNVLIALSINIFVTAMATLGVTQPKIILTIISFGIGGLVFVVGILSDFRSRYFPQGGVAIFFGTFNPFHKTHLKLIKKCLKERNVTKIYIHSTCVPKLHRDALRDNEITIDHYDSGMRVYKKTSNADPLVNYFPTGNKFYEYGTRRALIELVIKQEGLSDLVEVLDMPEIYEKNGFYGIISEIKMSNKSVPIHGIHGSDLGGMWVRNIYDESGWIYPMAVIRKDGVSATAIRNGALDMASPIVNRLIRAFKENTGHVCFNGMDIMVSNGEIQYETI